MRLIEQPSLSYSDVLIVPSTGGNHVKSRSEIHIGTHVDNLYYSLPIVNAPMDTIGSINIYQALSDHGSVPMVHRFLPETEQSTMIESLSGRAKFVSTGLGDKARLRVDYLLDYNNISCWLIDTANGYNPAILSMVNYIRNHPYYINRGQPIIWAGNVSTPDGLDYLFGQCGVDGIRVGIGGGSRCSTRIVTGCGTGQFTAIMECCSHRDRSYPGKTIIADGGIASSGDVVKALGAGADLVMIGSLLAGCEETDSKWKVGSQYMYRGMASKSVAQSYGSEYAVAEGVEGIIEKKGSVESILANLAGGIKSAMSYIGVRNLQELREHIVFRTISQSTWAESLPKLN